MSRTTLLAGLAASAVIAASVTIPLANANASSGPTASAPAVTPALPYDFNGDGHQDLAAGMPNATNSGEVVVLNGTSSGLGHSRQVLRITAADDPGADPQATNGFGVSVASADLNDDGYADLVVGSYGSVFVFFGSATGLHESDDEVIAQDTTNDLLFTGHVAIADVNNDGHSDILAPALNYSGANPAEVVEVLLGSSKPYSLASSYAFGPPNQPSIADPSRLSDFGSSIAVGDLNGDGHVDVVVGSSVSTNGFDSAPGGAWACPGTATGPHTCTRFGSTTNAVAIGAVTGHGAQSVVTSGPSQLTLLPGLPTSTASPRTSIRIVSAGAHEAAVKNAARQGLSGFGNSLVLGDLDGDGYTDMVIGNEEAHDGAGAVTVIRGSSHGFAKHGVLRLDLASAGIPGKSKPGSLFGAALSLLRVRGHRRPDLLIGAPRSNALNQHSGTATELRVTPTGLSTHHVLQVHVHRGAYDFGWGDGFGGILGQ